MYRVKPESYKYCRPIQKTITLTIDDKTYEIMESHKDLVEAIMDYL